MVVSYPTLCELYAAGKLSDFKDALRPSAAGKFAASTNSGSGSKQQSTSLGSSLSKSPRHANGTISSASQYAPASVVNRKDIKGRSALHLAAADPSFKSLDYLEALLACPTLQINQCDEESGYTALHRALYVGNLFAARRIMSRPDCDLRMKDREGLTAFDLFSASVDSIDPESDQPARLEGNVDEAGNPRRLELFTWGSNRNFTLGANVDGDRSLPEKVKIRHKTNAKWSLHPIAANSVVMSKFHTAVLTNEQTSNIRLCGYGSSGRMGNSGLRISLEPLADFHHKIAQVALGLDHTVLLTTSGDLFTFGLNHHGQLGYTIDAPTGKHAKNEEPTQLSPRRVLALRKEPVALIAASRYHTAAYTTSGLLYTWGANRGQLGYASGSIQNAPRIVSAVPAPIVQLEASDHATVCLLDSGEVFVLFRNTYFKMVFNPVRFPTAMQVYRPPNQTSRLQIGKISGGGADWLAISTGGDVFQWTLDDSTLNTSQASRSPICLWDQRRKNTAVVDAAIDSSSIILCTKSGHVFTGQKRGDNTKGAELRAASSSHFRTKQWKFSRVPFLQRVIRVATSGADSFGAIRSDHRLPAIMLPERQLQIDLLAILPHWSNSFPEKLSTLDTYTAPPVPSVEDESDSPSLQQVMIDAYRLCHISQHWSAPRRSSLHGSDAALVFDSIRVPIHSSLLATRSSTLASLFHGSSASSRISFADEGIVFHDTSLLSGLLLVHYLYSDHLPCLWDPRVANKLRDGFPKISVGVVRDELQRLAHLLHLPHLARTCGALQCIPTEPTLPMHLSMLRAESTSLQLPAADTSLLLSDGRLLAHSSILRARSPFFTAFFDEPAWTEQRRRHSEQSVITVDLGHLSKGVMQPVLDHIYTDTESVFSNESDIVDKRIDTISEVLSVANELLLDRLKIICAEALRPLIDLRTFAAILQEGHVHESRQLVDACLHYALANMETLLESGYLTDLDSPLVDRLQAYSQAKQIDRLPRARSPCCWDLLWAKHGDYVASLDLAPPPRATVRRSKTSDSPRLSPALVATSPPKALGSGSSPLLTPRRHTSFARASPSPTMTAAPPCGDVDDSSMFDMDDLDLGPSASPAVLKDEPDTAAIPRANARRWQQPSDEVSDALTAARSPPSLRQIMSDTEASRSPTPQKAGSPFLPARARPAGDANRPTPSWQSTSNSTLNSLPWRRPGSSTPQKAESFLSIQSQQVGSPTASTASPTSSAPRKPAVERSSSATQSGKAQPVSPSARRPVAQPNPASGLGAPVISPVRAPSSSSGPWSSRRQGQDSAWVNYQSASSFLSPSASSFEEGSSFLSIQTAQQDEGDALKKKSNKTLGEIQQEEEFERWFEAESRRYQASLDAEASIQAADASASAGRGGGRGRGSRGRGRGRPSSGGASRGGDNGRGARRGSSQKGVAPKANTKQ